MTTRSENPLRGQNKSDLPEKKQKKPGTAGAKLQQKLGKKGNPNKGKNAI